MTRLPVIVGLGGVNPAGRVSNHHAYRRLVLDALPRADAEGTYQALASMMAMEGADAPSEGQRAFIRAHTLIRRIEPHLFDPDAVPWQRSIEMRAVDDKHIEFVTRKRFLPEQIPEHWRVSELAGGDCDGDSVRVQIPGELDVLLPDSRASRVQSAGQLPSGFDPERLYQARSHPRGLQLTVYGASDTIRSTGIDWEAIRNRVRPDEIAVYAGSGMGQLDFNGSGGMLQSALLGKRVTSKQLPLGLAEMPADFINAYVLGSVGTTGTNIGACATFLYNLRQGMEDIRSGRRRVVIAGNSEAPVTPEIVEGYRTMGALAEDDALRALDPSHETVDHRRACRPFAENCGFTLSEGAVYVVLMDDALALELGASIHGSVADVFINADGYKKSIPGPGIGNYLTMAKAMASARAILGEESLRRRTYVQAHGTGTPQNRVTESHLLDSLAETFGVENWLVAAVKAYLGHSLAPAAGDQLVATLGAWRYGLIPGINTIDRVADDVHRKRLRFETEHVQVDPDTIDAAFLNSKGFGGNNASALILAPHVSRRMLAKRHGEAAMTAWRRKNEQVLEQQAAYERRQRAGEAEPLYRFGEGVLEGEDLEISEHEIRIPGFDHPVTLDFSNPYSDMT